MALMNVLALLPSTTRYFRQLYICGTAVFLLLTLAFVSEKHLTFFSSRLQEEQDKEHSLSPKTQWTLHETQTAPSTSSYAPLNGPVTSNWTFVPSKHAESYGLTSDCCVASFPGLFREIERATSYWQERKIKFEDVDISWKSSGAVRVLIHSRRLYVLETRFSGQGYHIHRALAILGSIHRAINSYDGELPNVEFSFSVSDIADPDSKGPGKPIWTFSRRSEHKHHWLMPDFGFWSWGLDVVGEYMQIRRQISQNERPFSEKIPRAVWRGAENSQVRKDLIKATKPFRSTWADIQPVTWSSRTKMSSTSLSNAISMPDHCRWQYLMHTEGVSYSGRGKYLFNCHSVVVAHELDWIENWHHLLVPGGPEQNFVQVKRDFSDLHDKMEELLNNPKHAQNIADSSVSTFRDRYLTPAAQACYWRELIRAWSNVSFEPTLWEEEQSFNKAGEVTRTMKRPRGIPYETYALTAFDELYGSCSWLKKFFGSC